MDMQYPIIIGIRHYSPACARLVAEKIHEFKPRYVLIEGPADFNERIDELYLPHQLPIAIYSYLSTQQNYRASWSPFLSYSPEWQALMCAKEVQAEVKFIDLPAWHDALCDVTNRYADKNDEHQQTISAQYEAALCEKFNISGHDALWDHLFEDESDTETLGKKLQTHFRLLRQDDVGSEANQEREKMMSRWVAWAMAQHEGNVLVVCGGYHALALEKGWQVNQNFNKGDPSPEIPQPNFIDDSETTDKIETEEEDSERIELIQNPYLPPSQSEKLRFGSYVVPYSFKRLDAFQGYASGMPSPSFYQWVWQYGLKEGGDKALEYVFKRLRKKKLAASTADLSSVYTRIQALANWRGHKTPLRSDYLDALAGSLVKTALDVPLPWDYRDTLLPGTDPILVEVMDVMAGDMRGNLAEGTPQPPLVLSVEEELIQLEIELNGELKLDLFNELDRKRSRCLHCLSLLEILGIKRTRGPNLAMNGDKQEHWELRKSLNQRVALIEASMWGATLYNAAQSKVEFLLQNAQGNMSALAKILNQAALAGLNNISEQTLIQLRQSVAEEAHFEAFGEAIAILFPLWQHGSALGMQYAPVLKNVLEAAFDRMLWLLEPAISIESERFRAHIKTHIELFYLTREAITTQKQETTKLEKLDIEPQRALSVWKRKAADSEAASISRGASLGALLSLQGNDYLTDIDTLLENLPTNELGDALMGLLALGRNELTQAPLFLSSLDKRIQNLDPLDFNVALPALRTAFGWLPSLERKQIAQTLVKLSDTPISAFSLTQKLATEPEVISHMMQREQEIINELARWGIFITDEIQNEETQ